LPEAFLIDPVGLRTFCSLASLRFRQVAGYHPSPRRAGDKHVSRFFIPAFFNSLLYELFHEKNPLHGFNLLSHHHQATKGPFTTFS
jgi:hypothetical protein